MKRKVKQSSTMIKYLAIVAVFGLNAARALPQQWQVVNADIVSGSHLHDEGVWMSGATDSFADCQALCAANATCTGCDWAGDIDIGGGSCGFKRLCYLRSDGAWLPNRNGHCNHTAS